MQMHSVICHLLKERVCEFLLIARDQFEAMAQAQHTSAAGSRRPSILCSLEKS